MNVRVATRPSRLALAQTTLAVERLREKLPDAAWEIVPLRSLGDEQQAAPLRSFGDKSVFVTAVEQAVVDGRADLAVHSLKDMPLDLPRGLWLPCFLPREDPRDVLVSHAGAGLTTLPAGARVGTGSARRVEQLRAVRPDLGFAEIRGNVDTRLHKVRSGEYDAAVLAGAGLTRLGLEGEITEWLDPAVCIPSPGQGIIAVECRENYELGEELLAAGDHDATIAAQTEREVARLVGATCLTPFGCLATIAGGELVVSAWLLRDGHGRRATASSPVDSWREAAREAAHGLLAETT